MNLAREYELVCRIAELEKRVAELEARVRQGDVDIKELSKKLYSAMSKNLVNKE